jgi:glycosyltransferase involved in cell wall biosynthesis
MTFVDNRIPTLEEQSGWVASLSERVGWSAVVKANTQTVLHVSEAFGGGVVAAVRAYVAASPEFRHLLAFADRVEAPLTGHDLDPFDAVVALPHQPTAAIRTIRRAVRATQVDIVHAHSAKGGMLARMALRTSDVPIVYSPHCLAQLRQDRSPISRILYRSAERAMSANTSVYASCSPYEFEQCSRLASHVAQVYVPNALPKVDTPPRVPDKAHAPLHLFGVGRLFPQKDPGFFAASVHAVRSAGIDIRATWIGDGETRLRRQLKSAGIEVTGWLPREESLRRLAEPGGIYLHSARWEGFPFAILEANAVGLPMIIRHIPMMADFAFPHEVREAGDVAQAVKDLIDPAARNHALRTADAVLAGNNPEAARVALLEAYRLALATNG